MMLNRSGVTPRQNIEVFGVMCDVRHKYNARENLTRIMIGRSLTCTRSIAEWNARMVGNDDHLCIMYRHSAANTSSM